MDLKEKIENAATTVASRVEGFCGSLGTLDAILCNYGDYSITLSCIALLNPELRLEAGCPIAKFPGSAEALPLDCFHVDMLHHSEAEGGSPEVLKAIGIALETSWNRVLKESHISGYFKYNEENGYDVEYVLT